MSAESMVNTWIQGAWERNASDIHFEMVDGDRIRVRARVDGDMQHVDIMEGGRKVIARLKVMAGLDVNERSVPLDGRIRFNPQGFNATLDLRFSSTPCMSGEKIVLRLIDNRKLLGSLQDVGFTPKMLAAYEPLTTSPNGLLLHVGPTGSGKTTSLYAVLRQLNRSEVNIQTVEDPVEYDVQGITQTQTNTEAGLNFPRVLRAMLRQDPDVILVGEIRDSETAEISVEAAMTGHLVLSTLHTNDAVGTVIRLLDMGIAPYGLAYALRAVVSQRLARKLCKGCKRAETPPEHIVKITGSPRPVYEAKGCKGCKRQGTVGRVPIYEFLPVTPAFKQAIYKNPSPDNLQAVARANGLISLWQDGLDKVWTGLTSLEEVLRVVRGVRDVKAYSESLKTKHPGTRPLGPKPGTRMVKPNATKSGAAKPGSKAPSPPKPTLRHGSPQSGPRATMRQPKGPGGA